MTPDSAYASYRRRRAKLIIDGAHLEACIKAAGEGRKGRLDHMVLLSLLEERLDVSFEKKILYQVCFDVQDRRVVVRRGPPSSEFGRSVLAFQATPDGQPNHFHRSISHPDGAHVKTVLQPLKARLVTVEIGGIKQTQELLLDKGVDLALALEILADRDDPSGAPSSPNPSAAVLVIITADGDLQVRVETVMDRSSDVSYTFLTHVRSLSRLPMFTARCRACGALGSRRVRVRWSEDAERAAARVREEGVGPGRVAR